MNYIITNNKSFFEKIGDYNYCNLDDMVLPKNQGLAIDTETTGLNFLDHDMFAVQIGTGENNYLIDLQKHNNGLKFEQIIPYIENHTLIGHNIVFDLRFFYKHNFFPKKVVDTFMMSKLLHVGKYYPFNTHNLGDVMFRELGIRLDKTEQRNIAQTQLRTKKAIQYAFNDVDKLLELARVLYKKHVQQGSIETAKLHNEYARVLAYMEVCGLPIDTNRWKQKMTNDLKELKEAEQKIVEYLYNKFPEYRSKQTDLFNPDNKQITINLKSQPQMIPVFKKLGINTKNKDGKDSIQKDVIQKTEHEFLPLWFKFQDAQHDVSTYGQNILDEVRDGRIYTTYNPILNTGRISTRKEGINFLNFPSNEKTRSCFVAPDGWVFVGCDYSGQENVVGADLHQDKVMIDTVNNGKDLHCAFARMLFTEIKDLSDNEIKKNHSDKRKFAKSPRFAFAYGGNAFTVASNLNIPLKQAEDIEKKFKELHKGIYEWAEKVYKRAIEVGYIETADGFRYHLEYYDEFKELHDEIMSFDRQFWDKYRIGKKEYQNEKNGVDIENWEAYELYVENKSKISKYFKRKSEYMRLCLNFPIQSRSAHQTKRALVWLFDYIIEQGHIWDVKIDVAPHDEIMLEVRENLAEQYKVVLEDTMVNAGNYYLTSGIVSMKADAQIGKTWYEVH